MTMNTIYILVKGTDVVEVAPSFNPDDALRHFVWATSGGGEMYAVRCSDLVAARIRELAHGTRKADALKLAKALSYSLTKCADVT